MSSLIRELVLPSSVETESIILQPSVQEYFSDLNAHKRLLKDKVRLEAFRKAIFETVKPGDIVMDIGAGTGILSRYALEAGASTVYLVEENGHLLSIAEDIISSQFPKANVCYIPKRSTSLIDSDIPQKADVIVSETIGSIGINEGILLTLADARRFLKSTGVIIPHDLKLYCALCDLPAYSKEITFPTIIRTSALNSIWAPTKIIDFTFLDRINFQDSIEVPFASLDCRNGMLFWFSSNLSQHICLSSFPNSYLNSWGNLFIPYKYFGQNTFTFNYTHELGLGENLNDVSMHYDKSKICVHQALYSRKHISVKISIKKLYGM